MIRSVFATIYAVVVISGVGYFVDEYYSAEALKWYSEQQENNFDDGWATDVGRGVEPPEAGCLFYLLGWRLIDNYLPTVSEFLAPAPKLNQVEAVDNVQKQDYYYDSWAGRIIKVDAEVRE